MGSVEHLRRNMTLLLDKITKELQKSKKLLEEVLDSLPADYKNRDLEEIHTFFDDFKVTLCCCGDQPSCVPNDMPND